MLSLASAGEFLFSGGQDGTIAVWKFDAASQSFMSAVCLPTYATDSFASGASTQQRADTTCYGLTGQRAEEQTPCANGCMGP